jgi:hypothetical protein
VGWHSTVKGLKAEDEDRRQRAEGGAAGRSLLFRVILPGSVGRAAEAPCPRGGHGGSGRSSRQDAARLRGCTAAMGDDTRGGDFGLDDGAGSGMVRVCYAPRRDETRETSVGDAKVGPSPADTLRHGRFSRPKAVGSCQGAYRRREAAAFRPITAGPRDPEAMPAYTPYNTTNNTLTTHSLHTTTAARPSSLCRADYGTARHSKAEHTAVYS